MSLFESSWFLISFLIIVIILLVDPKNSLTSSNANSVLGLSPSSGQQFVYNFSAVLILFFYISTTVLSLNN